METKQLLGMTPEQALVAMVNAENGTNFRPDGLIPDAPSEVAGLTTEVVLRARRASAALDVVPAPGAFTFQFERLALNGYFQGIMAGFRPTMPTSTQVILDELTVRTGQVFYHEDFHQDYIDRENAAPYVLRAKPESLRWYGAMEIVLGEWPKLDVYLRDATADPFMQVPAQVQLASSQIGFSHINTTVLLPQIRSLTVGMRADQSPAVVALFNRVAGVSPQYVHDTSGGWTVSLTPGPYNLYNATVVAVDEVITGTEHAHPANANLTRAVVVQLDLTYCTNFSEGRFYFPYQPDHTPLSTFADQPRMRQLGTVSLSDGTLYAKRLNGYGVGAVLRDFPEAGLRLSGPVPWVTRANERLPTNLYNAVVQHNGARRNQDVPAATQGLNRVMVVTVDESSNQSYRGTLAFYYRAPILLDETLSPPRLGVAYSAALNPRGGVAPYSTAIATGTLPDGLSLVAGVISGTPTVAGAFPFTIAVQDAESTVVNYNYRLVVTA